MAMNATVEEIIKDDTTATVYENDCSSRIGLESYFV